MDNPNSYSHEEDEDIEDGTTLTIAYDFEGEEMDVRFCRVDGEWQ